MFETINLVINDRTAVLTVNRPQHLNALNGQMLSDLGAALGLLEGHSPLAAVVVTGQDRAFVAGADIAEMEVMTPADALKFSEKGQGLFWRLSCLDAAVIAAVNGYALGGGLELAMACDIRVAAENAKFGQPEVGLGITPGFGGTQWMSSIVGPSRALELVLSGRVIDAAEALQIGLVHKVVPPGEALSAAMALTKSIAGKSLSALKNAKKAIKAFQGPALAFEAERRLFAECFEEADQKEGMRAFLEKRGPKFV